MFLAKFVKNGVLVLCAALSLLSGVTAQAIEEKVLGKEVVDGTDTSANTDTPLPDLFTGTMSYRIPIEVPPGRRGVDPGIVLTYKSTNGNGWLGVGWELEMGAIERSTKKGVNYGGNEFLQRGPGGVSELVEISAPGSSPKEYRAKIEGSFTKYLYYGTYISGDYYGTYWEAISKKGVHFRFGYTTRQALGANNTYKWYLDRITDPNGNYASFNYTTNDSTNQIYLREIDYTGNDTASPNLSPTNSVIFNLEDRNDAITLYTTNFPVKTAKRLKSIEIKSLISGVSTLVRKYVLNYDAYGSTTENRYSPVTGRSVLASVTEYGADGVTAKPPVVLHYAKDYTVPDTTPAPGRWATSNTNFVSTQLPIGSNCLFGIFGTDTDLACSMSASSWDLQYMFNGSGFHWQNGIAPQALTKPLGQQCIAGDFKQNGNTGFACNISNNNDWVMAFPSPSNSLEWSSEVWRNGPAPGLPISNCFAGDFDGNGKSDFACYTGSRWQMALSTGSGFVLPSATPGVHDVVTWSGGPSTYANPAASCLTGDFNGDGKTDFACNSGGNGYWSVFISNGSGWNVSLPWSSNEITPPTNISASNPLSAYCLAGDYNGDGKTDIACYDTGDNKLHAALSTGSGWDSDSFPAGGPSASAPIYDKCVTGDFNADGKTDIACYTSGGTWSMGFSAGNGWLTTPSGGNPALSGGATPSVSVSLQCLTGYADKTGNIACYPGSGSSWQFSTPYVPLTDLLTKASNGIGGEVSIAYNSTPWGYGKNSPFPFIQQFVSDISFNDGNGNTTNLNYSYGGGYYNFAEKEFRGFNYVHVIDWSNHTSVETWFHQGNDTAVDVNNPSAAVGYVKGKPYRTRTSDDQGKIYSETETTYGLQASSPYYFAPASQVDTYICDGRATGQCKGSGSARKTTVNFTYDTYGNVTREDHYGDVANAANISLNYTVKRQFSPNTTNWLVAFPATVSTFQGIGNDDSGSNLKISQTDYYYDDLAGCNTVATGNQTPAIGNLTRIVRWLNGGTSPESRFAYDGYGNPKCSRDPNGNVTTIGFDTTYQTFPTTSTNAKNQTTTSAYYGVGILADKGRFGQLKSITGPNNAPTTFEYDPFGRKTKETQPDNFWTRTAYNSFGTVGSQHIYTDNQLGMWSASYFDGLGRTFKVRRSGPDSKVIITETAYDARGQVRKVSLPYFEGLETPLYRTYTYDALGRVTTTTNPDTTTTKACYNDLITVRIDENGHRRRETRDPLGRLITVEEYAAVYTACDTSQGTPYASTSYGYDVLGNLTGVTVDASKPGDPANPKSTQIVYDTLGRKKNMTDPDMGRWDYGYYPDGTLKSIKDANHQTNGQLISFDIDELNRVTVKRYPADSGMGNVVYNYDESTSTNYKGRLTSMSDASGSTVYNYDKMGRPARTVKRVDGADYPITKSWDGLGRLSGITYPDNESVAYLYDNGGNLSEINGYAEYDEYNALGQPGKLYFGNGIVTGYWYYPKNNRLLAIKTDRLQDTLLYRIYSYDNKGNLTLMQDLASPAIPQTASTGSTGYTYDYNNSAHVLKGVSTKPTTVFGYDNNGNLKSDGTRTVTYTADNLPQTVTMGGNTTTFTYDGNGKRVKKSGQTNRIYIGKLHECTPANCGNYIYAGNTRIASSSATNTTFYHPDHLGSTAVTTDQNGNRVEDIAYYPFGETRNDSLPEGAETSQMHKYTGQEWDKETQLYNYGARLYDPEIGRFIAPDSIVPNPGNPQSLNRYAYSLNNPLKYRDPSGHSPRSCTLGFCSTVVNTAAVYAAPSGVPGLALKSTGIVLSLASMGNAYYENKVTHTMSDFDYKATMGLEGLNLFSAGSAAVAARVGRNIESVVQTAEVADTTVTTLTRAANVPLFAKDVFETFGGSSARGNALDQSILGSGQVDGSLSYLLSQSPMPELSPIPTYTLPTFDLGSWYQNYTPSNSSSSSNTGSNSGNTGSTNSNTGSSGGSDEDDGGDDE